MGECWKKRWRNFNRLTLELEFSKRNGFGDLLKPGIRQEHKQRYEGKLTHVNLID